MEKTKNNETETLIGIVCDLYAKNALKKVIMSKPSDKNGIKSIITPKLIGGNEVLQVETFTSDNKAYQKNIKSGFAAELNRAFTGYSQINVISTVGECQYMVSKNGKKTLVGENRIRAALSAGNFEKAEKRENNNSKNYILSGKEGFLYELAISDKNGRVHDKMQSKYRQINRFLEHIEAVRDKLPTDCINIYDLCCGKSYLSFAVYHYFSNILGIKTNMVCVDLKSDVIKYCSSVAAHAGFSGMMFVCDDVLNYKMECAPDLVISLHACDIATDVVLDKASENGAKVILSTPCCHHELNKKLDCPALEFASKYSMLRQKMCDALTDAMRLLKLECKGYSVAALELIDPEDTPKNIMLRAIKKDKFDKESAAALEKEYKETEKFLLGSNKYGH